MPTTEETLHVLRRLLDTNERDIKQLLAQSETLRNIISSLNKQLEGMHARIQIDHEERSRIHNQLNDALEDLFVYRDIHGPLASPLFDLTTVDREGLQFRRRK